MGRKWGIVEKAFLLFRKMREQLMRSSRRKYQEDIGYAIIRSVVKKFGHLICILVARQGGKNHTIIDVIIFLACKVPGMKIGFYAPTYTQAIDVTSRRLRAKMKTPILNNCKEDENAKIITIKKPKKAYGPYADREQGSMIGIFSHDPKTKKEGFTWDLIIIDEAQDLDRTVWEKEIEPTGSSTNATTVFIGTPWSKECIFYDKIQWSKKQGVYLEYAWQYVAKSVPEYAEFIKKKIKELGKDSIAFLTQYCLKWVAGLGMFFDDGDFEKITDKNISWRDNPEKDKYYTAGIDVAGDDQNETGQTDWTIITINEVDWSKCEEDDDQPEKKLVAIYGWQGKDWEDQYQGTISILKHWNSHDGLLNTAIDATGMGSPFSDRIDKAGFEVDRIILSDKEKSKIGHFMDAECSSGRVKIPVDDNYKWYLKFKHQFKWLVKELKKKGKINYYVDENKGNDDIMLSWFLNNWASNGLNPNKKGTSFLT